MGMWTFQLRWSRTMTYQQFAGYTNLAKFFPFDLPYTAQRQRQGAELFTAPKTLVLPRHLLKAI